MEIKKCTNCGQILQKIEGFYAITKVIKSGENIAYNPASGVPWIAYACSWCGKLELFAAKATKEWE